jgi:hypothetical protein
MSSITPTDFASAVEKQKALWVASRELIDEIGDDVYTRTGTPVIVADEIIGSHAFDEAKAERERRTDAEPPERAQTVAEVNRTTGDVLPGENLDGQTAAWDDLLDRGTGVYRGIHPVMERKGVYVIGCPHLLRFEDERPTEVVRLRGTKYVERDEPFESQLVGPWLTCRILQRGRFNVKDLSFTLLRYDRREHPDLNRTRILTQLRHGLETDGTINLDDVQVDVTDATGAFPDFQVNTYEYDSRFTHDSTDFPARLKRSIDIFRGEVDPS